MVPHLWGLEVANVLLVAERRGRISTEDVNRACTNLLSLPIAVDPVARDRALTTVLRLARLHGLTSYDAAYLELAIRHDLSIATLDAALTVAAESEGVERWRPEEVG
jgi:predicted nucleic acid-binding protein